MPYKFPVQLNTFLILAQFPDDWLLFSYWLSSATDISDSINGPYNGNKLYNAYLIQTSISYQKQIVSNFILPVSMLYTFREVSHFANES